MNMKWMKVSFILCMFGFLKEFRPNEPFIFDYLTGPWKNFTSTQITQDIYPISIYSNFATLIVIFLLTDFLRYKPIIILCGLSGVITFVLIVLGNSMKILTAVEFFYGLYMSTEVAYYTYIYAKVDKKHYQAVSGYTRSAILLGRFFTGIVSQLLVYFKVLDYHQLNYLTIAGQIAATIWALFLPSINQSIYFHRANDKVNINFNDNENSNTSEEIIVSNDNKFTLSRLRHAYYLLWIDFKKAYSNFYVLKWSIWWAVATCGYLQVLSYTQSIWQTCVNKNDNIYNGLIEAVSTVIGAIAVFFIGILKVNWTLIGETVISICSFVESILLFIVSRSYNIWLQYALYIIFGVTYHTIVTVTSSEIAKRISEDSFGLIFGINTFVALSMQSLLTFIVTSGQVYELDIRNQFAVYSGYFAIFGLIFILMAIVTIIIYKKGENLKETKSEINNKVIEEL